MTEMHDGWNSLWGSMRLRLCFLSSCDTLLSVFPSSASQCQQSPTRSYLKLWSLPTAPHLEPPLSSFLTSLQLSIFAAAKSLQSCLTLCDPIDSSSPGSPVPGILQAGTLEWVANFLLQCMKVKSESESEVKWSEVAQSSIFEFVLIESDSGWLPCHYTLWISSLVCPDSSSLHLFLHFLTNGSALFQDLCNNGPKDWKVIVSHRQER